MLDERERAGYDSDKLLSDRAAAAVQRAELDSKQGEFLLYRFLVAQPWSGRLAAPGMRAGRLSAVCLTLAGSSTGLNGLLQPPGVVGARSGCGDCCLRGRL